MTPRAVDSICQYSFTGNIRELANLMEQLVVLSPNESIDWEDLPAHVRSEKGRIYSPKGRLTWEQLVRVTSENVAKIFHLFPRKGCLQIGSDADVIIVDPEREWILGTETLQSSADFSVYEGKKVKGKVIKTFVRGNLIVDEGRFIAEKATGEYAETRR